MIPFRKSIGFRLFCIGFIVLALPLLVDSFILVQKRYEHTIADAKAYLVEITHLRAVPLSRLQPLGKPLFEVIRKTLGFEKNFPDKPSEEINKGLDIMRRVGDFSGMYLIRLTPDNEYIVVGGTERNYIGKNFTKFFEIYDLFSSEALKRGYTDYISFDEKTLTPSFVVAHGIHTPETYIPVGLLVVTAAVPKKLDELLAIDEGPYPVSFALVLESTVVFAATDPKMRFQYFNPRRDEYSRNFVEFVGRDPDKQVTLPPKPLEVDKSLGHPLFGFEWEGKQQVGYIEKLPNSNLYLMSYTPKELIFASAQKSYFAIYSIYLLILLIGGITAYFLARRMAFPIRKFSGVMDKIQKGEWKERYKADRFGFEINALGEVFNGTVDAVLEQEKVIADERVKKETLANELQLGQQVQRNLLPHVMPSYPGVDLAEVYIPAIEVGGDFFDAFVKEQQDQLVFAVADASGKGVQACFYSLSLRNMLRIFANQMSDVGRAMVEANNLFVLDTGDTGMFVTVLMAFYDHKTRKLDYFSCGHNPALVRRTDGSVEMLDHLGIAMGVLSIEEVVTQTVQLQPGDAIIFYTDGVTEAHNLSFEEYGEMRLKEFVKQHGDLEARELADEIVKDVEKFVGAAEQHDDITLLVMKVEKES